MNKKLVVVAALVFGAAGLFLAQGTVKAQENAAAPADNAAMNADNAAAPADNAAMNADNAAAPADNAAAPAANAAQ